MDDLGSVLAWFGKDSGPVIISLIAIVTLPNIFGLFLPYEEMEIQGRKMIGAIGKIIMKSC